MKVIARAVLAAFLLSLPGVREAGGQVLRAPVSVKPGLASSHVLPSAIQPSLSAPASLAFPAALTPSLLAAPSVALKPSVPSAAKATLAVAAKATAALTPKSGGSESKAAAAGAFEGSPERGAAAEVAGGEGAGSPPLPPASSPPSAKELFLAGIRQDVLPGKIVPYAKVAEIASRLNFDAEKAGKLFTELLKDGHLAMRDNRDAVYFTFRAGAAPADVLAGDAVTLMNSDNAADQAVAVAKSDEAVGLYGKASSPRLAEAKVLRANAALELASSMLKAHQRDLASRETLTPKLTARVRDVGETLAWLETATYEAGRVPLMPERVHHKLVALLGSLNPAGENGASASGAVADGYIVALDLLETYDRRDFLYEGPKSKGPRPEGSWKPSPEQADAFAAELRARASAGATVTRETMSAAGRALGLEADGIDAVLAELASRGQVLVLANGAVVRFDLDERARADEGGLWDLHNEALDAIKLANAPGAESALRAVARLDAALARYFSEGRKSSAIEQVSIALANAKLEAIVSALRSNPLNPANVMALAFLTGAYYSAERRQDVPAAAAAALSAAATIDVLVQPVFDFLDEELGRGAELTREFIESMGGGRSRTPVKSSIDLGMPEAVREIADAEERKLAELDPKDSEAQKIRTYLEWLRAIPWNVRTQDTADIAAARAILDRDHAGLELVKERVLEFLAVRKKTGSKKGAIIAFTGPPGTGKTSIASSIAEALGRKFVRLSLGGVHDESVLRGHGRTYVGSMPGEIMRQMKAAGTINPVMLLDEADKIGRNGNHGDPTAALLEILDPEQNNTYRDRYLDVPYDLSEVLFVVTSNELANIPGPLRDRMEIIEFDGYTTLEKIAIAEKHVVPQKRALAGLKADEASLTKGALRAIIEGYTMEAGVRSLREKIESVLRKISAWTETRGEAAPGVVDETMIAKYLGIERFSPRQTAQNGVGVATGLSVGAYGGSTLNVEVSHEPGTGRLILRKQFGDDIEDSAMNALKYVKRHAAKFGLQDFDFTKRDIDINITPAGKVDGPSAGGLMVTAIISALTGRPVAQGVAMTGEITMRGDILPIGGLKQKVMAAHRMGYTEVIFPHANLKDIENIPKEVRDGIKLTPARTYDEVYPSAIAL